MCVFINIFKTEIIILNWNKNRDDYIRNVDCKHKNPTVYESITTTLIWEIQHRIGFRVIPPPPVEKILIIDAAKEIKLRILKDM